MINKLICSITVICFLFIGSIEAKTRFFIQTVAQGDQNGKVAEGGLGYFETEVFNKIKKEFPCAEINSKSTVVALLGLERMKQLLGTGDDNALQNIAGAMGCEYLLVLKILVSGQSSTISAYCMDSKKAEMMANVVETAPYGNASLNAIDKVVKKLVDDLKEYEICPYQGKVTLEVESEKEETTSSSTQCDNGIITTEIKLNSKANIKWQLNKNGLRKGDGDVTYDLNEKTETTINNPCYICPDGTKTIAQINEVKTVEGKAQGLSNESVFEGQKVADCRIKIVFLSDETYNILVEATSQKGNLKTKTDKKVNAPCAMGDKEKPEEPRTNEIEIPLKVILGPYKGTTKDAVLSQDETKDLTQGKEKTTLKINFTLTQK